MIIQKPWHILLKYRLWSFPTILLVQYLNFYFLFQTPPVPLSWANITMFDYKGVLRSGPSKLYAWQCREMDCVNMPLNPLGTVVSNGNQDSGPCLLIDFTRFAEPVSYPTDERVSFLLRSYILYWEEGFRKSIEMICVSQHDLSRTRTRQWPSGFCSFICMKGYYQYCLGCLVLWGYHQYGRYN